MWCWARAARRAAAAASSSTTATTASAHASSGAIDKKICMRLRDSPFQLPGCNLTKAIVSVRIAGQSVADGINRRRKRSSQKKRVS